MACGRSASEPSSLPFSTGTIVSFTVHVGDALAPDGEDFAAAVRLRDRVRAAMLAHTSEPDLAGDI